MTRKKQNDSVESLQASIIEEMGRGSPRIDIVTRMVGRLNRLRGRMLHVAMLQLIGKADAQKKASALLGNNS